MKLKEEEILSVEAVLVEDELDEEEDGTVEVEESAAKD